ncbi:MAG: OadG family protein [Coriobacteriia bacterium]|nr:OadG family protein [Coriobacteriia bacterium]
MNAQMTMGDYLFYSVLGVCIVFCVLAVLILFIKLLTFVLAPRTPKAAAGASAAKAEASAAPEAPLAPGSAGDLKLYDTDPRDAAMIMAIVADELGKPLNELRFISIKEVK